MSKLFVGVREKLSLCYDCSAISDINRGMMIVSSGIDAANAGKAEEAIHAALWDYAEKNGIRIEGLEKPKSDIHEDEEEEEEY